jgi:hypothetical protein
LFCNTPSCEYLILMARFESCDKSKMRWDILVQMKGLSLIGHLS